MRYALLIAILSLTAFSGTTHAQTRSLQTAREIGQRPVIVRPHTTQNASVDRFCRSEAARFPRYSREIYSACMRRNIRVPPSPEVDMLDFRGSEWHEWNG